MTWSEVRIVSQPRLGQLNTVHYTRLHPSGVLVWLEDSGAQQDGNASRSRGHIGRHRDQVLGMREECAARPSSAQGEPTQGVVAVSLPAHFKRSPPMVVIGIMHPCFGRNNGPGPVCGDITEQAPHASARPPDRLPAREQVSAKGYAILEFMLCR